MKQLVKAVLACGLGLVAEHSARAAEIAGQIIDGQTGTPIARAHVGIHVTPAEGSPTDLSISTDPAGLFHLRNLPAGNCQMFGEKSGYLTNTLSVVLSISPLPVPVVLRLTRHAVVTGSVVDDKGAGVPLAYVQLFRTVVINGARQVQPNNGVQADETGEFRIFGITPGRYYVGANAPAPQGRSLSKLAFAPILYPGVTDIRQAQVFDLQAGNEEAVTIRLPSVPAHSLRGKVVSAGRFMNLSLQSQDPDRFPVQLNPRSDWDERTGTFKFSGVPAGAYVLQATTQVDGLPQRTVKAVTVNDADVDGILMEQGSSPKLTGRVTMEGHATAPGLVSSIQLRATHKSSSAQIGEDGSFTFTDLSADSYQIVVAPNGASYVRSIRQGGRDVKYEPLVIGEFPPDPIEIDLAANGATIEGALAVPASDPPRPMVIALFRRGKNRVVLEKQTSSAAASLNSENSAPGTSSANGAGRFAIQGVAPGDYLLFAWPPGAQIAYAEPGFPDLFDHLGVPVHLTEGDKLSVVIEHLLPKEER
jgi:hypothetical protein